MSKITTNLCIVSIICYYRELKNTDTDLNEGKNWKRLYKKGSGQIIRAFENRVTGTVLFVIATETEIIKVTEENPEIDTEFKYVYRFDNAVVYSHEKCSDTEFKDSKDEINSSSKKKFNISKDVKIGYLDCEGKFIGYIEFIRDSFFYGFENDMTTDSVNYFELEPNRHFVPAQEPVDVIGEILNGCIDSLDYLDMSSAKLNKLKNIVEKYQLNHLLTTM